MIIGSIGGWNLVKVADASDVFIHCHNISASVGHIEGWCFENEYDNGYKQKRIDRKAKLKRMQSRIIFDELVDKMKQK